MEISEMTYKTIEYQEKNVTSLLKKIATNGDGRYMFMAPTGSGKTIMMSKFLERFITNNCPNYAFIWVSPRKNLPLQSKEKIGDSGAIDCVLTDTITSNRRIDRNQVWFINWEKMSGNLLNDTEQGNSLEDIIKNTREDDLKIMLLIDEAHWGAQKSGTEVSYVIDEKINADIMIYITATPKQDFDEDHTVRIDMDDVKEEEMVISEIPLNYDLEKDDVTLQVDEKLLSMACKRRKILKDQYKDAGTNINPLLMVQIPNSEEGEQKRKIVEKILREYGMTEDQGNFVSLEDGKRDDDYVRNISDNDNSIDAVIFKQNVSLGWDCPRAKLLVGLRDTKEISFKLQTLGRIMRTPEQKYYENEELNKAYFYSEHTQFDPANSLEKILRGTAKTERRQGISMTNLPAVRIRLANLHDGLDTEEFIRIFRNTAKDLGTIKGMKKVSETEFATLYKGGINITRGIIDNPDEYIVLRNELEIQKEFELRLSGILNDNKIECKSLFNMEFIKNLLKDAIRGMFKDAGIKKEISEIYYQFMNENNLERLRHPVLITMNKHEKIMKEMVQKGVDDFEWNIPKSQFLSKCLEKKDMDSIVHKNCVRDYGDQFGKYAMSPTFLEIASKLELCFCRHLDRSNDVKWWYKNGTGRGDFAIVYYEGCRPRRFMPDFIVMLNDAKIGIFDTKIGKTLEEAGSKAKALYNYITEHPGLNLFGGIVTIKDTKWIINDGSKYTSNIGDFGWKYLDLSRHS